MQNTSTPIQNEEKREVEEVKIYRHFYDNPKDNEGKNKPNQFLGTFEIPKGSMNDYSFDIEGIRKEDGNPYTIRGQEVSYLVDRYNAGTKCFIEIKSWEEWNTSTPTKEEWKKIETIESELAIFWDNFANVLPKSRARSEIGDEKLFVAFKDTYLKIREHLLSQKDREWREKIKPIEEIMCSDDCGYREILELLTPPK